MIHLWRQPAFRNALMLRGFAVWLVLRVGASAAGDGALHPLAQVSLLVVVAGLVVADARRRNEDAFLANLGVSRWAIGVTGAGAALPFELVAIVVGLRGS